jgi:hypothetical protein
MRSWMRGVWSLAALSGAASIVWAAYTYAEQRAEQRRQDFLNAYNLVAGDLGQTVVGSIAAAIAPFYASPPITNKEWETARTCRDHFTDDPCMPAGLKNKDAAEHQIQTWILANVLDGKHDNYTHQYAYAANGLQFLYQYAKADPCNWVVVVLKFKKNMSDFWYYYPGAPGAYDASAGKPEAAAIGKENPEEQLLRADTFTRKEWQCLDSFNSVPDKTLANILPRMRKLAAPIVARLHGIFSTSSKDRPD